MKQLYKTGMYILFMLITCSTSLANPKTNFKKVTEEVVKEVICSGNITLTTQAQVDAFPAMHQCTEMTGTLMISGSDITNLDSLYLLTRVEQLLIKNNPSLLNLNGLSNLLSVGAGCQSCSLPGCVDCLEEGIYIQNNAVLESINGLSSLSSITANLVINLNPMLTNLEGLNSLTSIGGSLIISNNAGLTNIDALSVLNTTGLHRYNATSINISNNSSLTNIKGLRSIKSIPGGLLITGNSSLTNLDGLDSLTQLIGYTENIDGIHGGAQLSITDNVSLTNIDALSELSIIRATGGTSQSAALIISNNASLVNLNGLNSLTRIEGPNATLTILNNDLLTHVDSLASLISLSGFRTLFEIRENAALANVDGFSSLSVSSSRLTLRVENNPELMRCCGLYNVVNVVNPGATFAFSGNGAGCTKEDIIAGGPCKDPSTEPRVQPTNMIFSAVTDTTMTVSFTAATETPGGYITLMKAFGPPFPDDVPVDGTAYQVGNVLGSSTIVVGVGTETSLDIVYLWPDIEYYFDVFSFNNSNGFYDYLTVSPLEGSQRTTSAGFAAMAYSSTNYDPKLLYYGRPYPKNTVNKDRIVPFPNPFTGEITIPFTTKNQNAFVQIVIYDHLGNRITDVVSQNFDPGYHEATWTRTDEFGNKVLRGTYVYTIRTDETDNIQRGMLIAK